MFEQLLDDMRRVQKFREGPVSLHAPVFMGLEGFKQGLKETIDWFCNKDNLALYKVGQYTI